MRLLKINLLAFALFVLSVSVASAIQIRIENGAADNQVDVFLDMQGSGEFVNGINIGIESTDATVTYVGAEAPPTLPLAGGPPGIMLRFTPFAFLAPTAAYGQASLASDVPLGTTRALVDFFSATATDGSVSGTENVLMATLNYSDAVFAEFFDLQFGSDGGFFVNRGGGSVAINDEVALLNNIAPIPEPTTAMLLGLGLAGLGAAGRRPGWRTCRR